MIATEIAIALVKGEYMKCMYLQLGSFAIHVPYDSYAIAREITRKECARGPGSCVETAHFQCIYHCNDHHNLF